MVSQKEMVLQNRQNLSQNLSRGGNHSGPFRQSNFWFPKGICHSRLHVIWFWTLAGMIALENMAALGTPMLADYIVLKSKEFTLTDK